MQKFSRFMADYAPMLAFLGVYIADINLGIDIPDGAIYHATAAMIIITIIGMPIIYLIDKKISNKHLILSSLIIVFGGATLYLNDESYLKIKPTVFYFATAIVLFIGLKFGRIFMKSLFSEVLDMDDKPWHVFTIRFVIFFIAMAVLNEIVWRFFSTDFWVSFKFFGAIPLMFLFMLANVPFFKKHLKNDAFG